MDSDHKTNKKPGGEHPAFKERDATYFRRRRIATVIGAIPRPSSARVPGSGALLMFLTVPVIVRRLTVPPPLNANVWLFKGFRTKLNGVPPIMKFVPTTLDVMLEVTPLLIE
jgi:hypothetical protein